MANDATVDLNDARSGAWADSLIVKLEEVVSRQGGNIQWIDALSGDPMVVAITPVLVQFIKDNREALAFVGQDAFKSFLELMTRDQTIEALEAVYEKLDDDVLLAQYSANSAEFGALAAKNAEMRKFWVALAEQLAIKLIPAGIGLLF
jgi:hypothetical protein